MTGRDVQLYKEIFSANCLSANAFGSSETGPIRRYFFDKSIEIGEEALPVGYAVPDKEVLLLDEFENEVDFNCVGEIVVKSRYLSAGYWHRPDLTEAAFQPDSQGSDERIYRTGDLGLMRSDGCLIHMGRKDSQVKIRGQRVPVSELESILRQLDEIKHAVVVVREANSIESSLVVYLVAAQQARPTAAAVRKILREKIPDYMVPSRFVFLDSLPLTASGKVDRRALPDPNSLRPETEAPDVSPRTPIEKELTRIWAEVLSLGRVGIHDTFLDLGGHSLTAARIVSQVICHFQLEMPLQVLFQSPTIAKMAQVITQSQAKELDEAELNRILAELESLSDEQAQKAVARQEVDMHNKSR